MYIVVLVTCANKKEAKKIATVLLEKKLAACVNIIDKINSFFWWEGKIDKAKEMLLLIKSKKKLFQKLVKTIKTLHSYAVPEILALPILSGEKKYLEWLNSSLK